MDDNILITPHARMVYLINRLPVTSRDELIALITCQRSSQHKSQDETTVRHTHASTLRRSSGVTRPTRCEMWQSPGR